jgi:predicted nucleotidyltransferase
MRLAKTDVIVGLDAATARDLACELRLTKRQTDIDAVVPGGAATLRELQSAGDPWWVNTIAGNALAQASFSRPITRATAEHPLGEVLDRATRWNADPRPLVDVDEIVVFGSYLDPAAHNLGDLDLAVVLTSCLPPDLDPEKHTAIALRYARSSGRRFSTLVDELCWPETEAIRTLRGRSPAINITTEDLRRLTDRARVVYRRREEIR